MDAGESAQAGSDNVAPRRAELTALLIAVTFFVALAPTLTWMEFSSTMENLVVATAMEIRRSGNWLIPNLEGEPRVAKPPLAAWIAAATIRSSTLRGLDHADPATQAAAYRALAWDVRWPALLCSCLMLLAIFDLGHTVAGASSGLLATGIAATTLYFLRFGRQATTDVQLALWVSVAHAAIARIVLQKPSWGACLFAAAALGLALMSKGPVALLQTIVPSSALLIWHRPRWSKVRWPALMTSVLLMLIVGGAWYAFVLTRVDVWSRWAIEMTRAGSSNRAGNPFSYLTILLYMLPWTPALLLGLVWSLSDPRRVQWFFVAALVMVPLIIMSFFPDRKERYLLPLLGPCALLAARGMSAIVTERRSWSWMQWITILLLALGLPLAGAFYLRWYPPIVACAFASILLVLIASHWWSFHRRHNPFALLRATIVSMALLQYVFFAGYRTSPQGRSELRPLAEIVRSAHPDAQTHYWRPEGPKRGPVDFSIYMNRSTPWIDDPAQLPPSQRPQVFITLQQEREPDPAPPPGWELLARVARDRDWYVAFVRQGQP